RSLPLLSPYDEQRHPPPHPFPTRRSSDLGTSTAGNRRSASSRGCGRPSCPTHASHAGRRCWRVAGPLRASTSCSAPIASSRGKRDRKSTRLNSSHQIISYAVFCLKQKIDL